MSFDFSVTGRKLFSGEDFSPWVKEHMGNVQTLAQRILKQGSAQETSDVDPSRHHPEQVHVHHHYHSCWDYGWSGPWWGWGWGGPSYSPVTIYNYNKSSSKEKEEEDHTGLAIVSTVAFFALSFLCGKFYYTYNACKTQFQEHEKFMWEVDSKRTEIEEPPKDLGPLDRVNHLTQDLLQTRYNDACINLSLLVSGLASATFIAIGSIFKIALLRYTGLFAIFPIGGYVLFRLGRSWNDDFQQRLAEKINHSLATAGFRDVRET